MTTFTNTSNKTTVITSRQNPVVTYLSKLSEKKYRDAERLFLLDGAKLVKEAMQSPLTIEHIVLREDAVKLYGNLVFNAQTDARVSVLSEAAFERVTDEKAPQGIVAAVRYSDGIKRRYSTPSELPNGQLLMLDAIQNPDNFGAILRSAAAFGVSGAVCGSGCADVYGRRVMRGSMGAALRVGCVYTDSLAELCRDASASGRRIVATVPREGASVAPLFDFRDDDMIVIGNEGHGISNEILALADEAVYIPMEKQQESLNAAVAASVVLYEMYRQRCGK